MKKNRLHYYQVKQKIKKNDYYSLVKLKILLKSTEFIGWQLIIITYRDNYNACFFIKI